MGSVSFPGPKDTIRLGFVVIKKVFLDGKRTEPMLLCMAIYHMVCQYVVYHLMSCTEEHRDVTVVEHREVTGEWSFECWAIWAALALGMALCLVALRLVPQRGSLGIALGCAALTPRPDPAISGGHFAAPAKVPFISGVTGWHCAWCHKGAAWALRLVALRLVPNIGICESPCTSSKSTCCQTLTE